MKGFIVLSLLTLFLVVGSFYFLSEDSDSFLSDFSFEDDISVQDGVEVGINTPSISIVNPSDNTETGFYFHKVAKYNGVRITTRKDTSNCIWGKPSSQNMTCEHTFTVENDNVVKPTIALPVLNFNWNRFGVTPKQILFSNEYVETNNTFENETGNYSYTTKGFYNYQNLPPFVDTSQPFNIKVIWEQPKGQSSTFNFSINGAGGFLTHIDPTVSGCGELGWNNGEAYTLTQHVTSAETCFNIVNNSVILDCQSFNVTFGTAGDQVAHGVNLTTVTLGTGIKASNVTVKNCNIAEGNPTTNSKIGIALSIVANSTFMNNTIRMVGGAALGIGSSGAGFNNQFIGNNITTTGSNSQAIQLNLGGRYLIENNSINTTGSTSKGITIPANTVNLTIRGNKITTTGASSAYAIRLGGGNGFNNLIENNVALTTASATVAFDGGAGATQTNATLLNNNFSAPGAVTPELFNNQIIYARLVFNNSYGDLRWIGDNFSSSINTNVNLTLGLGANLWIFNRTVSFNTSSVGLSNMTSTRVNITMKGLNFTNVTKIMRVEYVDFDYNNVTNAPLAYDCTQNNLGCEIVSYNSLTGTLIFNSTNVSGTFVPNGTYPINNDINCGQILSISRTLNRSDPITYTECTGFGIKIVSSNIALDCAGFNLTGGGGSQESGVILDGLTNVTVRNCNFANFGSTVDYSGVITLKDTRNSTLINNTVLSTIGSVTLLKLSTSYNNKINESFFNDTWGGLGYDIRSNNNTIENNTFWTEGQTAIYDPADEGRNTIKNNFFSSRSSYNTNIFGGSGIFEGNTFISSGGFGTYTIYITQGDNIEIKNGKIITDGATAFYAESTLNLTLKDFTINGTQEGVYLTFVRNSTWQNVSINTSTIEAFTDDTGDYNQFKNISIITDSAPAISTSGEDNIIYDTLTINSNSGYGIKGTGNTVNNTYQNLNIKTGGIAILLPYNNHTFKNAYLESEGNELEGYDTGINSTYNFTNITLYNPKIVTLEPSNLFRFTNLSLINSNGSIYYRNISWESFSFNLFGNITLAQNFTRVNATRLPMLNQSATLTFTNLYSPANYQALVDPEDDNTFITCPTTRCSNSIKSGNSFSFNITSWTTYAVEITIPPPLLISIISPYKDQENNRLVLINISSNSSESIIYNWNGTNYTYQEPVYVRMPFGYHQINVFGNDSLGMITVANREFNVSLVITNGISIVLGIIGMIFLFLFVARTLNDEHVTVSLGLTILSFGAALVLINTLRNLILLQYEDVVFAQKYLDWNTFFIGLLVLVTFYFGLFIFFRILKRFKNNGTYKKNVREFELYG